MAYPTDCPFCKKGYLTVFDSTPTMATLNCSNCDKLVTVKTKTGKVLEVVIPGLSALVSIATIAAFFGITDISKIRALFKPAE